MLCALCIQNQKKTLKNQPQVFQASRQMLIFIEYFMRIVDQNLFIRCKNEEILRIKVDVPGLLDVVKLHSPLPIFREMNAESNYVPWEYNFLYVCAWMCMEMKSSIYPICVDLIDRSERNRIIVVIAIEERSEKKRHGNAISQLMDIALCQSNTFDTAPFSHKIQSYFRFSNFVFCDLHCNRA